MKVVIAYCPKDYEQASRLATWLREIGPYPTHSLLVVRDIRCGGDLFNESGFGELEEIINPTIIEADWPIGANFVFGMSARYIMDNDPQPWLFLEPDAIPLSKGWFDALVFEYKLAVESGKAFMGDDVNVENVPRHMSGVAIYPGNLIEHGAGRALNCHNIAWDMAIADATLPRMHPTKLIEHAWLHPSFPDWESVEREVDLKHAVLFHSSKDGSLIDRLREKNLNNPTDSGAGRVESSTQPPSFKVTDEPNGETQNASLRPAKGCVVSGAGQPIICDILIKSYPKDYEWLSYCLRGLEKFASGFRELIIIYPFGEEPPFGELGYINMRQVPVKETGHNPYLFQQAVKFSSHEWTDAPYILHIDSDTVPCAPFTPETFFRGGKPLWLMTPWAAISTPWREPTEKFIGAQVEYEFMRRFPILLPRSLHVAAAKFVELHHGKGATEYIVGQDNFSEFNALGALAYGRVPEEFEWQDTTDTTKEMPQLLAWQHWSHGGVTDELRAKFESILGSGDATLPVNLAGGGTSCSLAEDAAPSSVVPSPVQDAPRSVGRWPRSNGEQSFTDEARRHCDALERLLKESGGSYRSHRSMLLTELRKRRIVPPAKHKKK